MHQLARLAYDAAELGAAVAQVRKQRGLTQANLAQRVGVGRMTIVRLERGEAVSSETMIAALSECGQALAIVPKFSRVRIEEPDGQG
jgi:transcriptional regulator with XRE-family HTH domain